LKGKEFDVFDKPKILYEGNYIKGKKSKGKVITNKPILPSERELSENSRSKSAKLRVFEKADR